MSVPLQYAIEGRRSSELTLSIETGIREGHFPPGAALPSVRALAARLRLSPATVAATYRRLAGRGLVTGQGRRGTRVSPRPPLRTPAPAKVAAHLRNLADGNPDPELLPPLRPALRDCAREPRLYGTERNHPELLTAARRQLTADGIPAEVIAVVGGALDGLERVLQAHLRPGDLIAVEDPGYTAVLDLVGALGLVVEPVALDDFGPEPASLSKALRVGVKALIVTPRAQNPTGAALDEKRVRALRPILDAHPSVLLVEDDHAGPVSGVAALTLTHPRRQHWAVVRSVSKSLGPDLRLAIVAGDATTIARLEGRQHIGTGWVSHVLQELVARLWADRRSEARLRDAASTYSARRAGLLAALRSSAIAARGRSGLNVWIPVPDEAASVAGLAVAGWAVRAGERYRIRSPPAIRVTISTLNAAQARRFAHDLAALVAPAAQTRSA